MKMTIEPTAAMFTIEETMVRAWEGTMDNGNAVVAFVAAVQIMGQPQVDGLTPIPAPAADRSPVYRLMQEELWHHVQRLDDREMTDLTAMARARAAFRDQSCPEKTCAECGGRFRGPGEYCKLACAMAAA